MGRKKKNLSWSGEKKTYPHIEEGSLCHRPSNCNLSNLCGLYKSLVPEIVSWFLRFAESLAPLRARFSSRLRRTFLESIA